MLALSARGTTKGGVLVAREPGSRSRSGGQIESDRAWGIVPHALFYAPAPECLVGGVVLRCHFRGHVAHVPVCGVECLVRGELYRVAAYILLAVDDPAPAFDGVGDDSPVVLVAVPWARAGVGNHGVLDFDGG